MENTEYEELDNILKDIKTCKLKAYIIERKNRIQREISPNNYPKRSINTILKEILTPEQYEEASERKSCDWNDTYIKTKALALWYGFSWKRMSEGEDFWKNKYYDYLDNKE